MGELRSREKAGFLRSGRGSVVIAGTTIVLAAIAMSWPRTLRPGEVIDQPGTYSFPAGNKTLQITMDDDRNVVVTVFRQSPAATPGASPNPRAAFSYTFESEREWFVAIDRYQRLWLYYGRWDPAWGGLREMPSGGNHPYSAAVLMEGLTFYAPGQVAHATEVVSHTGHWAGVPQAFLDRIPDKNGLPWENVPAIPSTAPQFSELEEIQVALRLQRIR